MIEINVDPVAFLGIRWYGIMVALGITVLVLWGLWQIKKGAKISYDTMFTAALVGIPSGVVVSRLLHVVDLWGYYSQHPAEIIGGSGLTIYGAVLGGALGIWIYSRVRKMNFAYFADLVVPGIILAQMIGRVGCTINGCCYGSETDLPWAIIYTQPSSFGPIGISVQPTTVYEIFYLAAMFGVLMLLKGRLKPDGSIFLIYLSLYAAWRIGIDFIREGTPFLFGLHEAQVIGIVNLMVTLPLLALRTRWAKKESAATVPANPV